MERIGTIVAQPRVHRPVLLIVAAFSRYPEALQWGADRLEQDFGKRAITSPDFSFHYSHYYDDEMGTDLIKKFLAFEQLIDPASLSAIKVATNALEQQLASSGRFPETRPLNLDPGYLTEAKLVLATTKDRDHRLYLGEGIFGEVTLYFHDNAWRTRPWTYPDYASSDYHQFFGECRDYLRSRYRNPK